MVSVGASVVAVATRVCGSRAALAALHCASCVRAAVSWVDRAAALRVQAAALANCG